MPGTITFKPIEATLPKVRRGSIDTYLSFKSGDQYVQSDKCTDSGNHLHWSDSVSLKLGNQHTCLVELKDQETTRDGTLGSMELNLDEIEQQGTVRRWYPIYENEQNIGEVLLEASFISDAHNDKTHPLDAPGSLDVSLPAIEEQIKHQGSVPKGLDLDEYFREKARWGLEPETSNVKIAETNEFGDYQPMKAMPYGELLHQHGSGRMDQGSYYSGQQTSYGEAYPMTHKSVGTNQLGHVRPDRGEAFDRINPKGYAAFMSQAFDPHDQYNFTMLPEDEPNKVTSVVEKAYRQSKLFEAPRKLSTGGTSHSARVYQGTHVEPSDISNDQYHNVPANRANENILPYKYDEYGNEGVKNLTGETNLGAETLKAFNDNGKAIGEFQATRQNIGGSDKPYPVEMSGSS